MVLLIFIRFFDIWLLFRFYNLLCGDPNESGAFCVFLWMILACCELVKVQVSASTSGFFNLRVLYVVSYLISRITEPVKIT